MARPAMARPGIGVRRRTSADERLLVLLQDRFWGKCGILCSMRYPSVFVRDVTGEERRHLKAGLRSADACRVRRCQIILASEYGAGVPRIARQMGCSEQTVRNTIHAFTTQGVACLQRASSRPHTTRERLGSAQA